MIPHDTLNLLSALATIRNHTSLLLNSQARNTKLFRDKDHYRKINTLCNKLDELFVANLDYLDLFVAKDSNFADLQSNVKLESFETVKKKSTSKVKRVNVEE